MESWGLGGEVGEVAEVTELVEGFVWFFDCDLDDGGVGAEVGHHGCVEVGAVGGAFVRGKDHELRDAFAAGEGEW